VYVGLRPSHLLENYLEDYAHLDKRINLFRVAVEGKSLQLRHKRYTTTWLEIMCPNLLCR